MWVQSLGWEDPLEKEMAIHSSILAWWATVHGAAESRTQWAAKHTGGITSCTFLLWLAFFLSVLSFWYSPQRIHIKRAYPHLESDTSQFIYKCVSYFQVVCFCITNNVPKSDLVHASWSIHAWVSRVAKYKTGHPIQFEFWRKNWILFECKYAPCKIGIYQDLFVKSLEFNLTRCLVLLFA